MFTPTRVEISNAVKYPQFIKDPFLSGYTLGYNTNGKIQEWSGGFSMVYCFVKEEEKWALKVWHTEIEDNKERYDKISKHLSICKLPYFSEFVYTENGLLVTDQYLNENQLVDTFRMKWIDGTTLTAFISYNLYNKAVLKKLADEFLKMIKDLHKNNISHGDLQHDNIIIDSHGEIRLIDYDSICVPELDGKRDFCRGRLGFQHPSRLTSGFISSIKIDYFSELVIYLSILAVIENPILWDKYEVANAEYRLLFTYDDFLLWEDSKIKKDLNLLSTEIQRLVKILENYLVAHINLFPFFE